MLLIYPGPGPTPAVNMIRQARKSVSLNTYELTAHQVERALVAARRRGVTVRILIDGHPYRGKRIEAKTMSWCHTYGMACKTAPKRFHYDHAKYLIVDGRKVWIGTMNFTYSGFHRNRETAWKTGNARVVKAVRQVFNADWTNRRVGAGPRKTLILAPGAGRVLATVVNHAKGPVEIESEELGKLHRLGGALKALGQRLKLILPSRLSDYDKKNACRLARSGAHIRTRSSPYPHIKIIITTTETFLGSENLSYNSLHRNREMGLLLNHKAARGLTKMFVKDWRGAAPLACSK